MYVIVVVVIGWGWWEIEYLLWRDCVLVNISEFWFYFGWWGFGCKFIYGVKKLFVVIDCGCCLFLYCYWVVDFKLRYNNGLVVEVEEDKIE